MDKGMSRNFHLNFFNAYSIICLIFFLFSCSSHEKKSEAVTDNKPAVASVPLPDFNADSAYAYVQAQCDFGPRVPNTKAHDACAAYLTAKLKTYTHDVIVQTGTVKTFDGVTLRIQNIIGSFNPASKSRILLFAHWDSRPWADQDSVRTHDPILAADDGGSGVAVLMEIARQLAVTTPAKGIDLAFFDAEDWGSKNGGTDDPDSYALGTQYWTKNFHVANYTADFGILLDMVGGKNAQFRIEGFSKQNASFVTEQVWKIAASLGYTDYFIYQESGWVTDDHVYVNKIGIPSIDIIHSDPTTRSGFPSHWHTHADNMDVIDRRTLKAVGQTLLGVIFSN